MFVLWNSCDQTHPGSLCDEENCVVADAMMMSSKFGNESEKLRLLSLSFCQWLVCYITTGN